MYMWQLGRTTKRHCADRWGAKEERVHYLSRQLLPLVRVTMSLSHDTIPEILCYPAQLTPVQMACKAATMGEVLEIRERGSRRARYKAI